MDLIDDTGNKDKDSEGCILPFRKISQEEKIEIYYKEKHYLELEIPKEIESLILSGQYDSKQSMVEKMIFISHKVKEELSAHPEKYEDFFAPPKSNVVLPLYGTEVSCAFTSPADDYIEKFLSLDAHYIPHPASTFFVKACGNCMSESIQDGDMLIVDRSQEAKEGKIILAILDGEFTVKRMFKCEDGIILRPDNPLYPEIKVTADNDFKIWGVVIHSIRDHF